MNYQIEESKTGLSSDMINELTEAVGWGKRPIEKWQRILEVSSNIAYIKESKRLIAFGRILEDGVMSMFYDICVHPDFQHRGLGKLIMNSLIEKVKDGGFVSIGLFVWEENKSATQFYQKFGFEKVSSGMELTRYMVREG